jgi:hypothetical protein
VPEKSLGYPLISARSIDAVKLERFYKDSRKAGLDKKGSELFIQFGYVFMEH